MLIINYTIVHFDVHSHLNNNKQDLAGNFNRANPFDNRSLYSDMLCWLRVLSTVGYGGNRKPMNRDSFWKILQVSRRDW